MTCWRRLRDWPGVWEQIHFVRLDWLARLEQLDWSWAVLDVSYVRAVFGGYRRSDSAPRSVHWKFYLKWPSQDVAVPGARRCWRGMDWRLAAPGLFLLFRSPACWLRRTVSYSEHGHSAWWKPSGASSRFAAGGPQ